jgi:mono/diheme cytochrome c family protein
MNRRAALLVVCATAAWACDSAPGRPAADSEVIAPNKVVDFAVLYAGNCAGCHGSDGSGGAAIALADPVYLAIADAATIRKITTDGVPGTAMPAFAQSAGGFLTTEQIDVIVSGIRERWAKRNILGDANAPPHAPQAPGDPARGAKVYEMYCSSCHGVAGRGGQHASSIVDGAYLAQVSDQRLRTTVIVGRPEMGAPDWRGNVPGKPLSLDDVSDVVAWLAAQRPRFSQQNPSSQTASDSVSPPQLVASARLAEGGLQ